MTNNLSRREFAALLTRLGFLPKRRTKVGVLYADPVRGHTILLSEQDNGLSMHIRRELRNLKMWGYDTGDSKKPEPKPEPPSTPPPILGAKSSDKPAPPDLDIPRPPKGEYDAWVWLRRGDMAGGIWSRCPLPADTIEEARAIANGAYKNAPCVVLRRGEIEYFNDAAAEKWPDLLK